MCVCVCVETGDRYAIWEERWFVVCRGKITRSHRDSFVGRIRAMDIVVNHQGSTLHQGATRPWRAMMGLI